MVCWQGFRRKGRTLDLCEQELPLPNTNYYAMNERQELTNELIQVLDGMGYPRDFGIQIAQNLRTEKALSRMIGYLKNARPRSAEEIADEMLAIMEDRERWIRKKEAEYYNSKYNELLYYGLESDKDYV